MRADIPKHIAPGLQTIYAKAFAEQPVSWPKIAMTINSNKKSETYGWLGNVPQMKEFLDTRQGQALAEYGFTVTNRKWESTIPVEVDALEDDLYGQIRARVDGMGTEAKRHPDQLFAELVAAGFATACYDGQYFFSASHTEGDSGTQSNTGSSALSATTIKTAITQMRKIKDDKGKRMGINPNILGVPPDLEFEALEIVKSVGLVGSTTENVLKPSTNVLYNRLDVVVMDNLTDTNDWFLFDTRRGVKPFVFQNRVKPTFQALEGSSDSGFHEDMYYYGVRARYNFGYGMWQFAYGASVS